MISTLIDNTLLDKYELPREIIADVVCQAISKSIGKSLGTQIVTQESDTGEFEIFALKQDVYAEIPYTKIHPSKFKPRMLRNIYYYIEEQLQKKKVETEYIRYMDLQSQMVKGYVLSKNRQGDLLVEIERETLLKRVTLNAVCSLRHQPQHERAHYQIDRDYNFYVSKIYPAEERGMPRLDIQLSRVSCRLPEWMIRRALEARGNGLPSEENSFKCVERLCGKFSRIESEKRIHKDIIKSVSRELRESVFVKYGNPKNV